MSIEEQIRKEFNALPCQERDRMGRFMDYERIKQLRRERAKAAKIVADIDAEIKRAVSVLEIRSRN